mgnify:FL=1
MNIKKPLNNNLELEYVNCEICGSDDTIIYYESIDIKQTYEKFNIVMCKNCGFLYTNPRPKFQNIYKYYSHSYYSYKSFPFKIKPNTKKTQKRFLDIGCGTGSLVLKKMNEGYDAYGVDIDKNAVKIGKINGLNITHYSGKYLPFDENYFDIVNLSHTIEHIHYLNKILKEIHRILKPDGLLAITCPNINSFDAKIFGKYWRHLDVPRHLYHFSGKTLEKILVLNNYKIKLITSHDMPIIDSGMNYFKSLYSTIKIINSISKFRPRIFKLFFSICYTCYNFFRFFFHKVKNLDGQELEAIATKNTSLNL